MKKTFIIFIGTIFATVLTFVVFVAPTKAANVSLINCAITQIPEGQNDTQACFYQAKYVSFPTNCNVMDLPYNETCCCSQKTEYTCTWRQELTTSNPEIGTSNTTGGCYSYESRGTDCDPAQKPSSSSGFNTRVTTLCCCPEQKTVAPTKKADFIIPQLSINIDTVKLSQDVFCTGDDNSGECHIPWIAEYINGVYKYGFGIGGILAAIVLMAGGLMWLVSAGDATKITQAKDLILGSIVGLLILSSSYMILTFINPDLINMKPLKIGQIDKVEVEGDSSKPLTLNEDQVATFLGINCEEGTSVPDIINASKGKITYSQEKRGSMSNDNKVYFDCSSYAQFVRSCAGLSEVPAFTGDIFKDRVKFYETHLSNLKPGDLLGWPPDKGKGHVVIYLGNGLFADAHGGTGRQPGQAIGSSITFKYLKEAALKNNATAIYIVR